MEIGPVTTVQKVGTVQKGKALGMPPIQDGLSLSPEAQKIVEWSEMAASMEIAPKTVGPEPTDAQLADALLREHKPLL